MPCHITFICVSSSGLKYVDEVVSSLRKDSKTRKIYKKEITITSFYIGEAKNQSKKHPAIRESIINSGFVFLDLMGADSGTVKVIEDAVRTYDKDLAVIGTGTQYLRNRTKLGAFEFKKVANMMGGNKKKSSSGMKNMNLDKMMKMSGVMGKVSKFSKGMHDWLLLQKAWSFAGFENIKNMIFLILKNYGGLKKLPNPGKITDYSKFVLFDPRTQTGYKTFEAFKKDYEWKNKRPSIGMLFPIRNYPYYSFGVISDIINKLSPYYNVIPLGTFTGEKKFKLIEKHIGEGMKLDVLWDFLPFRFGAGPMGGNEDDGVEIFRKLNIPVMHPIFMNRRKINEWKEKLIGFGPAELIISIMLPELDGVIDTVPIGGLKEVESETISDLSEMALIEDRFDKLKCKSEKYISLRTKENKDKKIAFILYNYPPGEGNVGGGAFLDTFQSIETICNYLKQEGYSTKGIAAKNLEETFMNGGCCNSSNWSGYSKNLITYAKKKFQPQKDETLKIRFLKKSIVEWGNPAGDIMADGNNFFIPGIIDENIFVGLQPSRGSFENPAKNYHDKVMPPQHQYTAFYQWLNEVYKADAVIHVGTHGSLEFLPGKESGMSQDCYPDYLIGDMPHFYYYYTGNPSEATIAKRRSHGCLITYSGPAFKRSGSYGDILELEELIADYEEADKLAPVQKKKLYEKILIKTKTMNLIADDPENVDSVSSELIRMKTSLMPLGLHQIGKPFTKEERASFISAILNWKRGDIKAINEIIMECVEPEIPLIKKNDRAYEIAETLVKDCYFGNGDYLKEIKNKLNSEKTKHLDKTLEYGEESLKKLEKTNELSGLKKCLNGEFLEAHIGGDVIRDPEVFPTGYNIFQFDARYVPSEVAMERGKEIAESTIEYFVKENGKYPESISLVLWGLETSKTKGETIGQILQYLGVKITPTGNAFEKKFALIPLEKLKRPRIDVLITICGFFRDMFPNMLHFLDEVFEAVSSAEEPNKMNYLKKHAIAQEKELRKEMDAKEAVELARGRIFGPPEGQYGTGLTTMIENKAWTDESEIAQGYLTAQKHLYSRKRRGESQRSLFESNLKKVEMVSQVRSSVDYSITDLDHYYEYFGGLAKSVEEVSGEKPVMLYTDSSSSKIYTDEAGKAIQISVRTRLLNPEHINALLEHKVHGAQHLADRVENLVGLSATTGRVESWIFSSVKETFLDDREMFEKLKENNIYAVHDILDRLFEANQRGYWDATKKELEELKQMYLELEGNIEGITPN